MRIVAPIPMQGGPRIPKNLSFLKNGKNHPKRKKYQKRLKICQKQQYTLLPKVSNPSESVVSTMFSKAKSAKKNIFFCLAILDHFQTKMFKSETTSFHYFSPKDSEVLKILDIRLPKVGAKRRLNGTSRVNTWTDRQTHRQTFRLIESIGPEGRCFENRKQLDIPLYTPYPNPHRRHTKTTVQTTPQTL